MFSAEIKALIGCAHITEYECNTTFPQMLAFATVLNLELCKH